MKYVVYYRLRVGTAVNRAYVEYTPGIDVKTSWTIANAGTNRVYLQHEEHDVYTAAFAAAGMIGQDETAQRQWLQDRVVYLNAQALAAAQARAATLIPGAGGTTHVGKNPGDMTVDQHGRRGRVPHVPVEVFRTKPISPDTAMDAVRDFCKGGGDVFPRSN